MMRRAKFKRRVGGLSADSFETAQQSVNESTKLDEIAVLMVNVRIAVV